jgi:SPP1 gp7 family putative phage head morphogenesis protein
MALIRGVTDEIVKRAEATLTDMIVKRASEAEIADAFDKAFGWGAARSRLIARDQSSKFWGTLNRIRQEQAGVTEYEWWTCQDERVRGNPEGLYPKARPSHWDRHARIFRWDRPPSDGHPGEPIMCRCVARPILRVRR